MSPAPDLPLSWGVVTGVGAGTPIARHRRSRLATVAAMLALALTLGSCGGSTGGPSAADPSGRPPSTTAAPSPSAPTTAAPSRSTPSAAAAVVANVSLAPPSPVVGPQGTSVYGIAVAQTTPTPPEGTFTLVGLVTGAVQHGSALPSASLPFVAGSAVLVLEPAGDGRSGPRGPWTLYRASTGEPQRRRIGNVAVDLPVDTSPVVPPGAPVTGTVDSWVGAGSSLVEIDTATGAVLRRLALSGLVTSVSVSPDGRVLYAAVNRSAQDPPTSPAVVVTERSAVTGAPTGSAGFRFTDSASVDAVGGGVWVSYRTGMAGTAFLLAAGGLGHVAPPGATSAAWTDLEQGGPITGGPSVAVLGTNAWLASPAGLACMDASTGSYRGGTRLPQGPDGGPGWQPLAQTATSLFVTQPVAANGTTDIVRVAPPHGCSLRPVPTSSATSAPIGFVPQSLTRVVGARTVIVAGSVPCAHAVCASLLSGSLGPNGLVGTWRRLGAPPIPPARAVWSLDVGELSFVNGSDGYDLVPSATPGGTASVYATVDGGQTWRRVSVTSGTVVGLVAGSAAFYAVTASCDPEFCHGFRLALVGGRQLAHVTSARSREERSGRPAWEECWSPTSGARARLAPTGPCGSTPVPPAAVSSLSTVRSPTASPEWQRPRRKRCQPMSCNAPSTPGEASPRSDRGPSPTISAPERRSSSSTRVTASGWVPLLEQHTGSESSKPPTGVDTGRRSSREPSGSPLADRAVSGRATAPRSLPG